MKKLFTLVAVLVCFGWVANAQTHNVTLTVDMSNYAPAFTTVYVSGEFNGWSGNSNAMTDMGSGMWSTTVAMPAGDNDFKFTLDDWAAQENLTPGLWCTTTNGGFTNRYLDLSADTTLPSICWDSCVACADTALSGTRNITFGVDMSNYAGAYTTVYVSGAFNGWSGTSNPLTDQGNGIWSATYPLPVGFTDFKFTIDDWAAQETFGPTDDCVVTNGGFSNRLLQVYQDEVLGVDCWNDCAACPPPPTNDTASVTFQVDMSQYGGAFTQVYLSGELNGWSGNADPLTDMGNGIWSGTFDVFQDTIQEYKFTADNWAHQESFTGAEPCVVTIGPFPNRAYNVSGDSTLALVCWGECDTCGAPQPQGPDTVAVTFQVDMSQYGGSFTTPEVNGTFNGWCGNCAAMVDQGNGIWAITIDLISDSTYEYKFSHDSWAGQENFVGGEPCTMTAGGFTNRVLSLSGSNDVTLSAVCWESCTACGTSSGGGGESAYCNTFASHFATPMDTAQAAYVTIANASDSSMMICVSSANANAIDQLVVTNGSGAMFSGIDSTSTPGTWCQTLS